MTKSYEALAKLDDTVTVRDHDTTEQTRVSIDELVSTLS